MEEKTNQLSPNIYIWLEYGIVTFTFTLLYILFALSFKVKVEGGAKSVCKVDWLKVTIPYSYNM